MPKKVVPRLVDKSDVTALACCPLCSWRAHGETPALAWRVLYRHLRCMHNQPLAARLAQNALRNAQRAAQTRKTSRG